MTLHKLSAGSGYEYLTRQVAAVDSTEKGNVPLGEYYAAKGESPGVWVGSGLSGIYGLDAGDAVMAEQMLRLFGHGLDPATGDALGRRYLVFDNQVTDDFRAEVAMRASALAKHAGAVTADERAAIRARVRTDLASEIFVAEHGRVPGNVRELDGAVKRYSRPPRAAVAGFDLTFSPVKSVSTLWAVAPREVAVVIEEAQQSAVSDALAFIEREALFTREGLGGARQVETRGLIAAAFTHRDSRAGDPDLHTHVAVANKVQTLDGKWLAVYGRVLYELVVAASETYNTALERHLTERLGVQFADRPTAERGKRPVREIVGVDPVLNQHWSKRRLDIDVRRGELARDFQQTHGRPPTPVEAIKLAQQANLETRDAKHEPRSLADQRAAWREQSVHVLGSGTAVDQMVTTALNPARQQTADVTVGVIAERVVAELESRRATWKVTHVRAESQRQMRVTHSLGGDVELVVADVLNRLSINVTPDLDPIEDPEQLRRTDGISVYRHTGLDRFTSQKILDAEQAITTAAGRTDGRIIDASAVDVALVESAANGTALNMGQANLVSELATSGRRVQVAIAPAGSGKTTAMRVLASAWTDTGAGVLGLAPSAAAAAALQAEAGIEADTIAKFLHDLDTGNVGNVQRIGPGTLIIVDEAGMADTLSATRVVTHALDHGASVRLIGDERQLSAVGAGGVLRDIAAAHGMVRLDELMRFSDPAEAAASLALRDGDVAGLGFYFDNDRVHPGDTTTAVDQAFSGWSADRAAGLDALMLAATRDLVSDLNQRARASRLAGVPPRVEVPLSDGNRASIGDTILTRRNDRRLTVSDTDWVKNGDRWTITNIHQGAATARHNRSGLHTILPAAYVAEHVELGYASTVHTAQGLTADTMHGIITGNESRETLYTMMSRGRHANHLHLAIDTGGDLHDMTRPEITRPDTATEILEAIINRDGTAKSATTTARASEASAVQLRDAVARYTDSVLAAAVEIAGPERVDYFARVAEHVHPGLTGEPGWASLSARLALLEANGKDAIEPLHVAITYRTLGDAADPTAVVSSRLVGMVPLPSGPLPWLPDVPARLANDQTWGPYLGDRYDRVERLVSAVRTEADGETASWLTEGTHLTPSLRGDIEAWRAVHEVPAGDRRPTGPPLADFTLRDHQHDLDRRVNWQLDRQGIGWLKPITHIVGTQDQYAPILAERLAELTQRGYDTHRLLAAAERQGYVPDDHASSALDSRLTRLIAEEKRTSDARRTQGHDEMIKPSDRRPGGPGLGI